MSQRTEERIFGQAGIDSAERLRRAYQTGEYIDEHTTVTDKRTSKEVLSREAKCVVAHRKKLEAENVRRNKKTNQSKAKPV